VASPDDVEKIRAQEGADLKESFEIGKEGEPEMPNHWPKDSAGETFRAQMVTSFDHCKELHINIMRAIAVGLGIDEFWFDSYCDHGDNTLRLLHYPEVDAEVFRKNENQVRAGAHTDYGSITCLFQVSANS
jgi:isopenicillin N synthase-like dioxygenase